MANDFTISTFAGSAPRLAPHLITGSNAAKAVDCHLRSGMLESWREPLLHRGVPAGTLTSVQFGCCWIDIDVCADVAQGPVTCPRFFVTGWHPYPVSVTVDADCVTAVRRLGVPCPNRAPTAVVAQDPNGVDKDLEGRSYAYQYVNDIGERGSLSPGSRATNVRDGQTVLVSGWPVPDASWGVTHVRIYRTVSGFETGKEQGNSPDTTWMLVAETPVGNSSFTDSARNETLLNALEEDLAPPPPQNLKGIVWVEAMNTLAGFVGNRVYFSENGAYNKWPHYLDLDDNVCALVESNGLIYAMTDGRPYVIEGAADCEHAGCRKAVRLPGAYPMVGCGNRRAVRTRSGAVYPSHRGLVMLSGKSPPTVFTWPLYSAEDWQLLQPHTAVPVEFGGKLFVFMAGGAFAIDTPESPETGVVFDDHTELSDRGVIDAFVSRNGDMFLLKADGLYLWDRGAKLRPHKWESKEFVTPTPVHMGAVHAVFDGAAENVKLVVDRRTVIDRSVDSSKVARLPMWATGTRWHVTLEGTAKVKLLSVAPSMHDLGS